MRQPNLQCHRVKICHCTQNGIGGNPSSSVKLYLLFGTVADSGNRECFWISFCDTSVHFVGIRSLNVMLFKNEYWQQLF